MSEDDMLYVYMIAWLLGFSIMFVGWAAYVRFGNNYLIAIISLVFAILVGIGIPLIGLKKVKS